jgi:bisphosphoglycerate-independent phosphoglycerate mutase (AlkP superfamily)
MMSDHGSAVSRHGRVPLIFVFPGGNPHGRIVADTQLLDIAPSLLDYLGAPIPAWMGGQSLLSVKADPLRPILTAHVRRDAPGGER